MKHLLAFFLLLQAQLFFAQSEDAWQTGNIVDVATIKVPSAFECMEIQGQDVCRCIDEDKGAFIIVLSPALEKPIPDDEMSEFYGGLIKGMSEQAGGKPSERQDVVVNGQRGITFRVSSEDLTVNTYCLAILLENDRTLACLYMPFATDAAKVPAIRQQFFDSLVIKS